MISVIRKHWYLERVALPILYDDQSITIAVTLDGEHYDGYWEWADFDGAMGIFVLLPKPEGLFPHQFRLLDDDEVVYAYGYSDDSSSFAPLDWAEAAWGCTSIEYWNGNEWEPL